MPEIFMVHSVSSSGRKKQQKPKKDYTKAQWKNKSNWPTANLEYLTDKARAKDQRDGHRHGHRFRMGAKDSG